MYVPRLVVCLSAILLFGCASSTRDTLTQVSTIDAILAGAYDGHLPTARLAAMGDLGIGTFQALDGEMIVLDGVVYQVRADGKVYRPGPDTLVPFATVVDVDPASAFTISAETDMPTFCARMDAAGGNPNLFYAIRATGRFSAVHTRSVPAQTKPYPPLVEATAHQSEFRFGPVHGTVVGFRCPEYVKGVNVPGWHLHFLSDDHTRGGHLLGFTMEAGTVELDPVHRFVLLLPENDETFQSLDLSRDRSRELERAEK